MKEKFFSVSICFLVLLLSVTGFYCLIQKQENVRDTRAGLLVAVNEIEQLALSGRYDNLIEKTSELSESIRLMDSVSAQNGRFFVLSGICVAFLLFVFFYIYFAVLRPFEKMKQFAGEIAQGNFDIPLDYERSNYFGEFTWAFDCMRREITKARLCEREAIENNKTVIATLSHDIKTPISSIRAYVEGLEACLCSTPEKREKYFSVIMKKCDEVSGLTNDLFLHSLSDLDKLKINPKKIELCGFLKKILHEIPTDKNEICFLNDDFTIMVSADKKRLEQVIENIINNAGKYAKSQVDVSLSLSDGFAEIHFRDYGTGIPDEDMPFIFDKFYRGKNSGSEPGSGLGLYIVKYITKQMGGNVLLHNHRNGLEVIISLPFLNNIDK